MVLGRSSKDLSERSPITHIEKIKTPLLLIHGDEDNRVNVDQSRKMAKQMKKHKKVVEYMEIDDEGHSIYDEEKRALYFSKAGEFLQRYLN